MLEPGMSQRKKDYRTLSRVRIHLNAASYVGIVYTCSSRANGAVPAPWLKSRLVPKREEERRMNAGRGGARVDASERKGRAHARTAGMVLPAVQPFLDHCSCCESGLCEEEWGGGWPWGWGTEMGRRRRMLIDVAGGKQAAAANF